MRTIEVDLPPSSASMYLRALRTSGKSPGAVMALPEITYVRPRVVLAAGHIARYAALCGFVPVQGVPPTYPQLLTFPLVMQFFGSVDCPWPAMGTVHLANAIEQHDCLRAGDAVRVEMNTGRLFTHEKGQVFTLDLRILRDGQLVWQATQTLLRVGVTQLTGEPYASRLVSALPLSRQADLAAPGNIGRRYGRVSGDMNPIHLSALSARLFGFRRAIAHGLWTKARALAALLPAAPVRQAAVAVEFKTPLLLPARASLWTTRSAGRASFEVRDSRGERPHLRGALSWTPDP
jgi:hypothetical protein